MKRQHRRWLLLSLCLILTLALAALPVCAAEGTDVPDTAPGSDPAEVPDEPPRDGDWCADADGHWRADAVSQGIPSPHVDEDGDGICDVCQWELPGSDPVEVPDEPPRDGDWCADANGHWRADAVSQGIPSPHVDADGDGICDVCQWVLPADPPATAPADTTAPATDPAAPDAEASPQTGDRLPLALWALLLSAGALFGVLLPLRRGSKQQPHVPPNA